MEDKIVGYAPITLSECVKIVMKHIPIAGKYLSGIGWANDSMGEILIPDELYCNTEGEGRDYWMVIPLKDKK